MEDVEIILLGNRGSGKTTLLATMAYELDMNEAKFGQLHLKPQDDEFRALNAKWAKLLKQLETEICFTGEYAGNQDIVEHNFVFTNGRESLPCRFVDTPGGETYAGGNTALNQRVEKAVALICVVDAVDLMTSPSVDSARDKCAVPGIKRILKEAAKNSGATCLFVLTKCERYTHSLIPAENFDALAKRFTECFAPVLEMKNLTSYYLPVETLGCLEFFCFEGEGDERKCKWMRTAMAPQPVNTLVPLGFAMMNMLEKLKEQKTWWQKFWQWISESTEYEEYMNNLLDLTSNAEWLRCYDSERKALELVTLEAMAEDMKNNE